MKKRGDSMMLSVKDDLLEGFDELDDEDSISVDFRDSEIEREWILIWEICLEEYFEDDLEVDEQKFVNEKISKKL
jgi:phosphate uptake regulator